MEFIQVLTILCLTFGIYCNEITSTRDIGMHFDDAQSSIIQLQTQLMDQTRLLREQSKIINELTNNVTELQERYRLQEQANKHQKTDIQDLKHQIAKQQFLTKSLQQSGNRTYIYFHCSLLSLKIPKILRYIAFWSRYFVNFYSLIFNIFCFKAGDLYEMFYGNMDKT